MLRQYLTVIFIVIYSYNASAKWEDISDCTNECGGGVLKQIKTCKHKKCANPSYRFKLCNVQKCPEDHIDIRDLQCGQHITEKYQWLYYQNNTDLCSLTCRAVGTKLISKLEQYMTNGSPCDNGAGRCINGNCLRIGCDSVLDSAIQVDECGVCGGNGSSCHFNRYEWIQSDLSECSVSCGVGRKTKQILCFDKKMNKRVKHHNCDESKKPKRYQEKCMMRSCIADWMTEFWSPCSKRCGTGITKRRVLCGFKFQDGFQSVNRTQCIRKEPLSTRTCRLKKCPPWKTTAWSECSHSCGVGLRTRKVECKSKHNICDENKKPYTTKPCENVQPCPHSSDPKGVVESKKHEEPQKDIEISQMEQSDGTGIVVDWYAGAKGPCSALCGAGLRTVTYECRHRDWFTNQMNVVPDFKCLLSGAKPEDLEECKGNRCNEADSDEINKVPTKSVYVWRHTFRPCSKTCLGGIRTTFVECALARDRSRVSDSNCRSDTKPEPVVGKCNEVPCPPRWEIGPWGKCNALCGGGIRKRTVQCVQMFGREENEKQILAKYNCPKPQPIYFQACNKNDCNATWNTGEWSRCEPKCGNGLRLRTVSCQQRLANRTIIILPYDQEIRCERSSQPDAWQSCNKQPACKVVEHKGIPIERPDARKPPKIIKDRSNFIQTKYRKRIKLTVGGVHTVIPGTTVRIRCPVRFFRRRKIKWKHKGMTILPQGRKKMTKKGVLIIKNIRPYDGGIYTCIAGTVRANVTIQFHSMKIGENLFRHRKLYLNSRAEKLDEVYKKKIKNKSHDILLSDAWDSSYNQSLTPYDYVAGDWSPCSKSCEGNGTQTRKITCELITEDFYKVVEERHCIKAGIKKPPTTRICTTKSCPRWVARDWDKRCPNNCIKPSTAFLKRKVDCVRGEKILNDTDCGMQIKPLSERLCVNIDCKPTWKVSEWSFCSSRCGSRGIQTRSSTCVWKNTYKPAYEHCKALPHPMVVQTCHNGPCKKHRGDCRDKSHYCTVVIMLKLCPFEQYQRLCCKTCNKVKK